MAAVIIAEPSLTPPELGMELASPPLLMLEIEVFEVVQVTELVASWEVPSLQYVVAVNCWVVPMSIDAAVGATLT